MLSGLTTLDLVVTLTELIGNFIQDEIIKQNACIFKIFCGDIEIWRVPTDLEDVSKYPNLFAELLRQGWSEKDLEKLAGKNMLRVMRRVEQVICY